MKKKKHNWKNVDFQGLADIEKYNLILPLLSDIDVQKDNRWQAKQREDINLNHSTTDSKVANKVPLFLFLFRRISFCWHLKRL